MMEMVDLHLKSQKLRGWVTDLTELPADAEEWGEVETFAQAVRSLAETKRQEFEAVQGKLQRALRDFTIECREQLTFFGVDDYDKRTATACSLAEVDKVTDKMGELRLCFDRHAALLRQSNSDASLVVARERRAELEALEHEIVRLLNEFSSLLISQGPELDSHEPLALREDEPARGSEFDAETSTSSVSADVQPAADDGADDVTTDGDSEGTTERAENSGEAGAEIVAVDPHGGADISESRVEGDLSEAQSVTDETEDATGRVETIPFEAEAAASKEAAKVVSSPVSAPLASPASSEDVSPTDYAFSEIGAQPLDAAPNEADSNGSHGQSAAQIEPANAPAAPTADAHAAMPGSASDESSSYQLSPAAAGPQPDVAARPRASSGEEKAALEDRTASPGARIGGESSKLEENGLGRPIVQATVEQPDYLFSPEQKAAEIASLILEDKVKRCGATLRDLVWRLVFEDRPGLAVRLAAGMGTSKDIARPHLPVWLLRAVALGPRVRHANGEIAHLLKEGLLSFDSNCFIGGDSEWDHAVRFLCAAAAMRPSVLAPSTDASSVLRQLHMRPGLVNLYKCWQSLADYGSHRQALDPNALKGARDGAAWQRDVEALRQRVAEWSARAPRLQMQNFTRATQVWRKWQEKGQLISTLVSSILRNDPSAIVTLKDQVGRLSDDAEVRREIDNTDRRQLKNRLGDDIMAKGFVYLRNHLRVAVGFAQQWIELQETHPGRTKSFGQKQAEDLSREMLGRREAVCAELQAFEKQHTSFYVRTGIEVCRKSLEDIWRLFDSETVVSFDEPDPKHILNAEFLKSSSLRLDEGWNPQGPEGEVTEAILHLVAAGEVDWRTVFDARSDALDHEATAWIVDYLEGRPDAQPSAEELSQLRERELEKCRDELEREVKAAKEDIEGAVVFGLLRENELINIKAQVGAVEAAIPGILRFREELTKLRDVRREIALKREEEVRAARERLTAEGIAPNHPAYERIADVLNRGDVFTANEYIDQTLQNMPLPADAATENAFSRFFPQVSRELKEFMEPQGSARPDLLQIANNLRAYAKHLIKDYSIGPVDLKGAGGTQAEHAAYMLEAWFTAKKERSIDRIRAKHILSGLGFSPIDWEVYQSGGRTWISLTAESIEDRERCPLPTFGSNAKGRYRILCVWDRPTEGNLLDYVGDTSQGSPVIVFHFGRLTEPRRRELARLCRHRRRTFIVLDDTLMLYLCGEPEPRLRAMFECTLPFTFAEPYTTTAGLVPIEMFYGRDVERRSIMDPMGSCFIYGGRQLGKTALLRDVERRFNDQQGRVALWFDVKAHGIGLDKKYDALWGLLAAELRRLGIPVGTERTMTIDKFLDYVLHWLEDDETRRLLLLLDEADDFLVYDGRVGVDNTEQTGKFMRAERLRGAMARTNRRFKVVFAGLHNVQRTTRLANHPLAHYGDPICIGPLLDNGEWREARDLIEQPMALIGYGFDTPDLVTRILWQTNYYPSLIQLYCNYLLEHVTKTPPAGGPPFVITSNLVDEAYLELRNAIRKRLIWTLQLDQRYEVIAYAMALSSITDKKGLAEGFPVSWIRQEALSWWPEGFRNSASEESIRTLLDEMVGLGILRKVEMVGLGILRNDDSASQYALRSTNVAFLMGTEDEIIAELLTSREAPLQYEPATYRATLRAGSGDDEAFLRSPLTAQQESDLCSRAHGVNIIFGCQAAGVEDLEMRLEAIFGRDSFVNLDGTLDKIELERKLSEILERRRQGITLALVPSSCPWSAQWVVEAAQKLKGLKPRSSFVRVVFISDPVTAWQLITDAPTDLDGRPKLGVPTFSLRPWDDPALRLWLDDCRFVRDQQTRERISAVTGNWPLLLRRFFEYSRSAETLPLEHCISKLSGDLSSRDTARELMAAWGMDSSEATDVFRYLNTGEATAEELALIMNDIPPEMIGKRLLWADYLGLVVSLGDGRWRVDKTVGRLLSALGD